MTFSDFPNGYAVFVDANVLIYHFTNHPGYGTACTALVERIELRLFGAVAEQVLANQGNGGHLAAVSRNSASYNAIRGGDVAEAEPAVPGWGLAVDWVFS